VGGLVILRRSQVSAVAGILGINFSIALNKFGLPTAA
jgi:hypothetical protein